MLVIVGASGKLGFATLNALLEHKLLAPTDIACTTSSEQGAAKLEPARQQGVQIRHVSWDDSADEWEAALQGCTKLFLISSARIDQDFGDAPAGAGREADHFRALRAAQKLRVGHVYYTSLAFANPSLSWVMKAHERTEEWLRGSDLTFTILREGLYNESWPLYFGHYDTSGDDRREILVAGDNKISWTSIADLGLATALVLAAPSDQWAGQMLYLAQEQSRSLHEVAAMVSKALGKEITMRVVSRDEHERFYTQERGMDHDMITWWSRTYDALRENECEIQDRTLERLLAEKGVRPTAIEETVARMLQTTDHCRSTDPSLGTTI